MDDRIRWVLGLAVLLLLLLAAAPQPASADGIVLPPPEADVAMPDQKAILVYDEQSGHEDLILSVGLLGDSEAAWVVPVPSLPEVKAASPEWFEQLSELTAPRIVTRTVESGWWEDGQCVIIVTQVVEAQVELLSREQVGVYDVSILSADEPGALLDWLNDHGYAFPEEGGPLLDTYVEEGGWYFVAARLLPGKRAALQGRVVQPLWFSFDAKQPVYPMRLTALMKDTFDMLIYVLADHRMQIAVGGFKSEFAGELVLQPRYDEADLQDLLTSRPYYVTELRQRLYAPELAKDLHPRRAAGDEAYREVGYRTESVCPPVPPATATPAATEGPSAPSNLFPGGTGWLAVGMGLALVGLLAALALIWRRPVSAQARGEAGRLTSDCGTRGRRGIRRR